MAKRRRLTPVGQDWGTDKTLNAEIGPKVALAAGLIAPAPIARVAGDAATTAAFEAVSDELRRARIEGRLVQALPLAAVQDDYLVRDRILAEDEDLAALMASLRARGQQTPIDVVDLGGGSLELVRVSGGAVHDYVSLPLGILRVAELTAKGPQRLNKYLQKFVSETPWLWHANDLPLYLVGGSWRALARLHLFDTAAPLPVIGNHIIPRGDAAMLAERARKMERSELRAIPSMPSSRVDLVPDAAALLAALVDIISPSKMLVCAFGLREGLLFAALDDAQKAQDPLIAGARYAAEQSGRFAGYGDALARWLGGLFPGEKPGLLRLRHAACLMADISWSSNPEFRALSSEELALHGNWVGVSAGDRAILATALYASFGGRGADLAEFGCLIEPHIAQRATLWGLAIRLAHRLSGGTPAALDQTAIKISGDKIVLKIPPSLAALDTSPVRGRLARLATAMNLSS